MLYTHGISSESHVHMIMPSPKGWCEPTETIQKLYSTMYMQCSILPSFHLMILYQDPRHQKVMDHHRLMTSLQSPNQLGKQVILESPFSTK